MRGAVCTLGAIRPAPRPRDQEKNTREEVATLLAVRAWPHAPFCADFTMGKCYLVTFYNSKIRPKTP